jgi:DNA (cytosine-5)-methyltransferase 1
VDRQRAGGGGYKVRWKVLNAADYGIPQLRKRFILVARRDRLPKWPKATHGTEEQPHVTMAEALGWLPDGSVQGRDGLYWVDAHYDQSKSGEGDLLWPLSRPATTIAGRCLVPDPGANANRFNGKKKSRNDGYQVSIGELAALQGFPSGFHFIGTKQSQALQIGNAVPPALAEAVVRANAAS